MAGLPILRHGEEMDDLSKAQFVAGAGGPFVNAVPGLTRYLICTWRIHLLKLLQFKRSIDKAKRVV